MVQIFTRLLLAARLRTIDYYGSDPEVLAALHNPRRNWYLKFGLRYFLYQYELQLLGGNTPALDFEHFTAGPFKPTTVEHILPQQPADPCWLETFSDAERDELTNALGNLVLTSDNS